MIPVSNVTLICLVKNTNLGVPNAVDAFWLWLSPQRIFGEASEKNLYLSQLIILDTLEKCLAGVSLPLLTLLSWSVENQTFLKESFKNV